MVEAAGRLPAGDRSRGWPGDSAATAASAASAPPSALHWRGHSPRDHRHLTFLKCVYYSGSEESACTSVASTGRQLLHLKTVYPRPDARHSASAPFLD